MLKMAVALFIEVTFVFQIRDEGREHRFIEKFWCVNAMQHGKTLRHQLAFFFQQATRNLRFSLQNAYGNVVTLLNFTHTGGPELQDTHFRSID